MLIYLLDSLFKVLTNCFTITKIDHALKLTHNKQNVIDWTVLQATFLIIV